MATRKKPVGEAWKVLVEEYDLANHKGKLEIATRCGITYDTLKHWRSEQDTTPPGVEQVTKTKVIDEDRPNVPFRLSSGSEMATFAILGDFHNPYQDNKTLGNVERFLEETQPNYLVYNGDVNDFYQVSVFDKDPSRLGCLQEDLNVTVGMFERHNRIMPDTEKIFIEGTHEYRWFKYLRQCAPALAKLDGTNITELYKLDKWGITYVPFERGLLVNEIFLILHGNIVSVHSSYTAKRHYEKHGGCGMCNHTHRGGSYYKRDRFGTWGWWENFCLCRLDPDWIQNPDWTQGFSLVHFKDSRFWVEQIPIIDSTFIYGGKVYK